MRWLLFKYLCIFTLLFFQPQTLASVQLGSPKILIDPTPLLPNTPNGSKRPNKKDTLEPLDSNISNEGLLKVIEEVVSHDHPEMFGRWQSYLRSQNLDPENEDKTMRRLQQKYLDSIQSWGAQVSDCESTRSSGRWLRRLRRKFGEADVSYHKKQIAKIITSLYLKRKTECMQSHEEKALRAEREIYAFSLERTRLLIDFISQNSELRISSLNKYRLLSSLKRKQSTHTLSERSVDLNSLRLETKLQNLPKLYVDFLAREQSFKKPFDLHKSLSLLSPEYDKERPALTPQPPRKTNRKTKKILEMDVTKTTS